MTIGVWKVNKIVDEVVDEQGVMICIGGHSCVKRLCECNSSYGYWCVEHL